jgi:leader peptidase (prepilin peptidase) / N-methyltransferase
METRDLPNEPSAGGGDGPIAEQIEGRTKPPSSPARHFASSYAVWAAAALCAFIASAVAAPGLSGFLGGGLAVVMIVVAAVDARHFVIPDKLVLAALALGLLEAFFSGTGRPVGDLLSSVLRAVVMAALFLGFRIAYRRIRGREGLGLGDVKLAAVAGLWLNWMMAAIAIDIAAVSALATVVVGAARGRKISGQPKFPFGLFFAPAIWLAWLFGAIILR